MNISHKIKFNKGQDANQMLVRKLVYNFLQTGKIETTVKKAKVIKSEIDSLIYKVKHDKKENKHFIYKHLTKIIMVKLRETAEGLDERVGGYVLY